ncbi:MAG: hypothetical protein EHM40_01640 [Chloroflexi bacterium]|nr:MAG: hypothetical protein EHM40_22355 [Chloroflexota bacterium]RPI96293.1 MAG: hypothetical protein EHM40_01640 [Chloroflexota bacterium]
MATKISDKPNGPVAAALLAGGIGSALFGLIVFFAALSESFATALNWYNPVGPLSGKSILGVAGFFIAWVVLHALWKDKEINFSGISTASLVLLAVGLLGTFPPVWELFGGG